MFTPKPCRHWLPALSGSARATLTLTYWPDFVARQSKSSTTTSADNKNEMCGQRQSFFYIFFKYFFWTSVACGPWCFHFFFFSFSFFSFFLSFSVLFSFFFFIFCGSVTHRTLRQQGGTREDSYIHLADWTLSVAAIEKKKCNDVLRVNFVSGYTREGGGSQQPDYVITRAALYWPKKCMLDLDQCVV